jgi:hypothetical protein
LPREKATTRSTDWPGTKPMMKTPLPATLLSFEKLSTGTFAARAIGATAVTSSLRSGPRISLLPSATACRAAAAAPSAVS